MQALSSHYEIYKRVFLHPLMVYPLMVSKLLLVVRAGGAATMTFSGVVSRNTSPTTSLLSAVTSLNATGTTLGAPLAQVASVCPVCQEALSDEESAEAPPAAEEARRFRGSVLTAGRGSGWEPADTTVSAEEHAKKITTRIGGDLCDCPQVLLSALPHIARKGECEGETFAGFPTRVQSPARRRPILRSKIAAPKKTSGRATPHKDILKTPD